jgi:hypothetical protein
MNAYAVSCVDCCTAFNERGIVIRIPFVCRRRPERNRAALRGLVNAYLIRSPTFGFLRSLEFSKFVYISALISVTSPEQTVHCNIIYTIQSLSFDREDRSNHPLAEKCRFVYIFVRKMFQLSFGTLCVRLQYINRFLFTCTRYNINCN